MSYHWRPSSPPAPAPARPPGQRRAHACPPGSRRAASSAPAAPCAGARREVALLVAVVAARDGKVGRGDAHAAGSLMLGSVEANSARHGPAVMCSVSAGCRSACSKACSRMHACNNCTAHHSSGCAGPLSGPSRTPCRHQAQRLLRSQAGCCAGLCACAWSRCTRAHLISIDYPSRTPTILGNPCHGSGQVPELLSTSPLRNRSIQAVLECRACHQ